MNIDRNTFIFINHFAIYYPVKIMGIFFAEYLQYVLGVILAVLLFYPVQERVKHQSMVVMAFVSALIARYGVKTLILFLYARPRPYIVLVSVHKLISSFTYEDYQSFPSGHAIFFFALATTLYSFNKKLGWWYFAAALLMGVARVLVGVHWPSDILAGAVLGVLTGWVVNRPYFINKLTIDNWVARFFKALRLG